MGFTMEISWSNPHPKVHTIWEVKPLPVLLVVLVGVGDVFLDGAGQYVVHQGTAVVVFQTKFIFVWGKEGRAHQHPQRRKTKA